MAKQRIVINGAVYTIIDITIGDPSKFAKDATVAYIMQLEHLPPPEKQYDLGRKAIIQLRIKYGEDVSMYQHAYYETHVEQGTLSKGCPKNSIVVWVRKRNSPHYFKPSNREFELGITPK